jgi:hypothetical protein
MLFEPLADEATGLALEFVGRTGPSQRGATVGKGCNEPMVTYPPHQGGY